MKKDIKQRNTYTNIELREDDGVRKLVGKIPYNSRSFDMGFLEVITPTAFKKTISDGAQVLALIDHSSEKVIGNTRNGSLVLTDSADGLICEVMLPETSYAKDAYELVRSGYVTTMSFGFSVVKDHSIYENGHEIRFLEEVKLREVSFLVPFPAYGETESMTRSVLEYRNIDYDKLTDTLSKKELTIDDTKVVSDIITQLNSLLPKQEVKQEPVVTPAAPSTEADTSVLDFLNSVMKELKTA